LLSAKESLEGGFIHLDFEKKNLLVDRNDFPGLREYIYLNSAAVGLLPQQTIAAIKEYLESERIYGNILWSEWEQRLDELRVLISRLIHSKSHEEIAFTQNTSAGLNIVANGIKWKKGENIVINDMEFPANIYPWQNQAKKHGLDIRIAKSNNGKVPVEEYEKLIDDNTRVVAVSWVEFQNGFTHNLSEIAELSHEHGAYFVVDGIQGLGMLTLDVQKENVDFFACGGSKWLISPIGTGFLYIKREYLEELDVTFAGWRSHKDPDSFSYAWFEPAKNAKRFDGGSPNVIGAVGMNASINYLLNHNPQRVQEYDLYLAYYLVERLNELENIKILSPLNENGNPKSSIISFATTAKNIEKIHTNLKDHKIITSLRLGAIRVSIHLYNSRDDIDVLTEMLKTQLRSS